MHLNGAPLRTSLSAHIVLVLAFVYHACAAATHATHAWRDWCVAGPTVSHSHSGNDDDASYNLNDAIGCDTYLHVGCQVLVLLVCGTCGRHICVELCLLSICMFVTAIH